MTRASYTSAAFITALLAWLIYASPIATVSALDLSAEFVAIEDTTIAEESPHTSVGDDAVLNVDGSPEASALVRFELTDVPTDAMIAAATLSLYVTESSPTPVDVHLVEGDWSEATTRAFAPGRGTQIGTLSAAAGGGTWVALDVTSSVAGNGTLDLYLVAQGEHSVVFASSESENGPVLSVSWASADGDTTRPVLDPDGAEGPVDIDSDPDPDQLAAAQSEPSATTFADELPDADGLLAAPVAAIETATFRAVDDAYVTSRFQRTNYGDQTHLVVDGSPRKRTLLRFDVSGIPSDSEIESVHLRLYALDSSGNAGEVREVSGDWSESRVTWVNAPDDGDTIATLGAARSGSWLTRDVTEGVAGNGSIDFYLVSGFENGAYFASSESSRDPELVIRWNADGDSAPTAPRPEAPLPSGDCPDIPRDRLDLLNAREGFGRNTTGAANGCWYVVTNDNNSGEGSLRWAAERGGYWITFAQDMTIDLSAEIDVAGNTTIDGRGRRVTIEHGGLYINHSDSSNVILTNLTIRNGRSGEDLVQVRNGSTNFWLDHLTLTDTGDEFIDIASTRGSGARGTISWSRFEREPGLEHEFAVLIGDGNYTELNRTIQVTLHHNWFNGTHQRNPSVNGTRVHLYNNVIQWRLWGVQVKHTGTSTGAHVVSENDIYDARYTELNRDIEGIRHFDDGNHVRVDGAMLLNDARALESNSSGAFRPSDFYGYDLDAANGTLLDRVTGGAGAR